MATNYEALELTIRGSFETGFEVEANYGPAHGSGPQAVDFPYSQTELEKLLARLKQEAQGLRRAGEAGRSGVNVEAMGKKLFDAVFDATVRDILREAQRHGPVRVRLRVDAPELVDVPWEYLYDGSKGQYLALRSDSPVVRTFPTGTVAAAKLAASQLNVLVMVAGGGGAELSAEQEFDQLEAELAKEPDVTLTRVARPTIAALQEAVRAPGAEFHVFHFIGHGRFDDHREASALYLEDESGAPIAVPAEQLTRILSDHDSLRLVMLNSCEGARASVSDPRAGLAQQLFVGGVQVVIAMQYEITDPAALTFSHLLYQGLARHQPVEQAITEARKPLDGREWATPVVFMRSDGRFFTDTAEVAEPEPEPAPEPQTEPAPEQHDTAPTPVQAAVATQPAPSDGSSSGRMPILIGVGVIVAILAVVGFLVTQGGGDDSTETADAVTTTEAAPADETTTTTTTGAPTTTTTVAAVDDDGGVDDTEVDLDGGFVEPVDPPFPDAVRWEELAEDECFDALVVLDYDYTGRDWTLPIDCEEADVNLVFQRVDFATETELAGSDLSIYPGFDLLTDAMLRFCEDRFVNGTNLADFDLTIDDIETLTPHPDEWELGIEHGLCYVLY